jgi:hypothetical protein
MDSTELTADFLNSINSDDFAPLFNTNNNVVSVIQKGRKKTYNVLERSKEIDAVIAPLSMELMILTNLNNGIKSLYQKNRLKRNY